MAKIGRLEAVPIRELWKHEERDFSAWLEANLDMLSEAIGVDLSAPKREMLAGAFECDLVCEDANGNRVIIENQLEATNHDHLGKLLTYLTNLDAKAAIWIATSPRSEHIRAVEWLNEVAPDDIAFYLVRLAAYRMTGQEAAAPLFTIIAEPTPEAKSFGKEKKELAEAQLLRLRFWEGLLECARRRGVQLHSQRAPGKDLWLSAGAGVQAGISFTYLIWVTEESGVEIHIGTPEREENKRIFDSLFENKEEIERSFGAALLWERMDERNASRVRYVLKNGGLRDEARWPSVQAAMVDAMDRLAKAVKPYLVQSKR